MIKFAELIADKFVSQVKIQELTPVDEMILHGIKTVAISGWAQKELIRFQSTKSEKVAA